MTAILNGLKFNPAEEKVINAIDSERAKEFIKLMKLQEEIEREKERMYHQLNDKERQEAFSVIKKQYSIPDYLTVREVADLLEVTPQMVRRYCSEGKLKGHQRLAGSGKWRIDTEQFINHRNWDKFLIERAKISDRSFNLAMKMLKSIEEEE